MASCPFTKGFKTLLLAGNKVELLVVLLSTTSNLNEGKLMVGLLPLGPTSTSTV